MLFSNKKGVLSPIKKIDFKLEKELQTLIENNMQILFGIKFLASEFSLNIFRFDSVAFDNENNAFIIVEYKKGSNDSLVDQGYAYLNTVLDRKADLVLLYNNINKANKQLTDFDWSATRVYFISPKFTAYQKAATGFEKMPFVLYEVNQYNNGDITIDEIKSSKIRNVPSKLVADSDTKVKGIKVYTEEDLICDLSDSLKEIYNTIKERILELGNINVKPTKLYVAFKYNNTNICDIEPYKKALKVFINVPKGKLIDDSNITNDISKVGHHGNGDYSVDLSNVDDIDYLMILIKQSYKLNS